MVPKNEYGNYINNFMKAKLEFHKQVWLMYSITQNYGVYKYYTTSRTENTYNFDFSAVFIYLRSTSQIELYTLPLS